MALRETGKTAAGAYITTDRTYITVPILALIPQDEPIVPPKHPFGIPIRMPNDHARLFDEERQTPHRARSAGRRPGPARARRGSTPAALAFAAEKADMQMMTDTASAEGFAPLPRMRDSGGETRRVGVEIEFAGLTEQETAKLVVGHLGGEIEETGAHLITIRGTAIGKIEVELDTALKSLDKYPLVDAGLDAARGLIPVEIVTEPIDWTGLERLDALREILRKSGALGTHDGVLLGFGVHFNVSLVGPTSPYTSATILAFGLLEDWLRARYPIDPTRRLMPFVERWPKDFVETLAAASPEPGFETIRNSYAAHCNSRNFALDLLPLMKSVDEEAFKALFPDQTNTKGRPAFHYRLPDSRIDEPDWSLAAEWERWRIVEVVADTPALLGALANDYLARDKPIIGQTDAWVAQVAARLGTAGLA